MKKETIIGLRLIYAGLIIVVPMLAFKVIPTLIRNHELNQAAALRDSITRSGEYWRCNEVTDEGYRNACVIGAGITAQDIGACAADDDLCVAIINEDYDACDSISPAENMAVLCRQVMASWYDGDPFESKKVAAPQTPTPTNTDPQRGVDPETAARTGMTAEDALARIRRVEAQCQTGVDEYERTCFISLALGLDSDDVCDEMPTDENFRQRNKAYCLGFMAIEKQDPRVCTDRDGYYASFCEQVYDEYYRGSREAYDTRTETYRAYFKEKLKPLL